MVPGACGSNAYTNFLMKSTCLLLRVYAFFVEVLPLYARRRSGIIPSAFVHGKAERHERDPAFGFNPFHR